MKIISVLALCLLPTWAFASPFLICDPYPTGDAQPDQFVITIDAGSSVISAAQTLGDGTKRLHYDLATLAAGTHNVTVKARIDIWNLESSAVPFSFTKPAGPGGAVGIKLEK